MTQLIRKRIGSETGASLMMSLLLMLVCTTVASITIAAATAVSGRLSKLEDRDRSYYNVTSAARVFWNELEKDTTIVKVVRSADRDDSTGDLSSWKLVLECIDPSVADTRLGKIDVTIDDSSHSTVKLDSTNATIFQLLTTDLLFGQTQETDGKKSLANTLSTYQGDAGYLINSIDATGVPEPKEVFFGHIVTDASDYVLAKSAKYESYDITVADSTLLKPVEVRITRNEDETYDVGTYDFVFIEKGSTDGYRCTLTAEASIYNAMPWRTAITNGHHYEWVTTVSWKPISIRVGGAL